MKLNLEKMISEKNADFLDPELIELSSNIDKSISECLKCSARISKLNQGLKDIKGCHLSFYYYGKTHLIMNMCSYIIRGIEKEEKVYLSMESDIFKELKNILKRTGIKNDNVEFYPVEELIKLNAAEGLEKLKNKISCFGEKVLAEGYSGIRWIGQPSYAIGKTSKDDFLKFESSLTEAVKDSPVSILCIYDSYDYMHDGTIIDSEIIEDSLHTHTHWLSEFKIAKYK